MTKVLVIGAQNIDIFALSKTELVPGDSNPAKINMAFGGVGRNLAVNLNRLGHDVHFITVFGDDEFSNSAQQSLENLGVNTQESLFLTDASSSIYLAIMNKDKNLHLGINDMQIIEELNPVFLQKKLNFILSFDLIVIDNNLPEMSIKFLLSHIKENTIAMDAVSAYKARKLRNHLNRISILKLNQLELDVLSSATSSKKQLEELHLRGAKTILLTNQEQESMVSMGREFYSLKPDSIKKIANTSGAGDAFLCGYLHGLILKKPEEDKLKMANIAAGVTLSSDESTSKLLSSELLVKAINE